MIDGFDPDKFRKVNKDSKNSSNYDTGIHVERQFNSSASSNGSSSTRYVLVKLRNTTNSFSSIFHVLRLVFLLISNLISWLSLHQFLGTKTTEVNKSLKTDANGAN